MSDVLGVIDGDGYTERGTLAGVPHLYPAVTFRWRPMLVLELADYYEKAAALKGQQLRRLVAALLAGKVREWDLKGEGGKVLPINSASMLSLKPQLFDRLFNVVSGTEPPDALLGKSEAEDQAAFEDTLKALETGQSPQALREERDVKN